MTTASSLRTTTVRVIAAAALVVAITPAHASTVIALSPAELQIGSDRIVEGTVVGLTTRWNATHTGFETHVALAIGATLKGPAAQTLAVVVPGGTLDGARHVIVGMPSVTIGDHARWHLRDRGDGTYRVYGWAQGKWPAQLVNGKVQFAPAPIAAEHSAIAFATNGMIWPAAKIPVQYLIQNAGSQDVSLPDEIAAIDAAFATWQAVPTASLTFQNAGMTDLGMAVDTSNVMLFVESGWTFGSEAAAATSLFFIVDGEQSADIAVNGQNFTWAISPPGSGITSNLLDLQAVMTHEIGHFAGLGHTQRSYDTMYFSWKPWQGQRSISIDDKLGLSSIYPITGDECTAASCPAEETCNQHPLGKLCEGVPDPIGAACSYDRAECDSFCLFTNTNLSAGYCSKFCETNPDCPLTHHCDAASAGGSPVKVCFEGAQPLCAEVGCPPGLYCVPATNVCTLDCRTSEDCGAGSFCDDYGKCVEEPGDGGCNSSGAPALLGVLLVLGLAISCRRSSRTTR